MSSSSVTCASPPSGADTHESGGTVAGVAGRAVEVSVGGVDAAGFPEARTRDVAGLAAKELPRLEVPRPRVGSGVILVMFEASSLVSGSSGLDVCSDGGSPPLSVTLSPSPKGESGEETSSSTKSSLPS